MTKKRKSKYSNKYSKNKSSKGGTGVIIVPKVRRAVYRLRTAPLSIPSIRYALSDVTDNVYRKIHILANNTNSSNDYSGVIKAAVLFRDLVVPSRRTYVLNPNYINLARLLSNRLRIMHNYNHYPYVAYRPTISSLMSHMDGFVNYSSSGRSSVRRKRTRSHSRRSHHSRKSKK